jgi:hypothetical protein
LGNNNTDIISEDLLELGLVPISIGGRHVNSKYSGASEARFATGAEGPLWFFPDVGTANTGELLLDCTAPTANLSLNPDP